MRRAATGLTGAGAVLALLAGYAGLDVAGAVPGPLTTAAPPTAAPLPTAPAAAVPDATAAPVLPAPDTAAPVPAPAALERRTAAALADPALGGAPAAEVADALTGERLLSREAAGPRAPASVTKLLTAAAALSALGPTSRAATTVVAGEAPGQVVLRAGGDVLLAAGAGDPDAVAGHAGLADLAAATAAALRTGAGGAGAGGAVTVLLDDGAFTGPAVSPGWAGGDVAAGYVAPIAPVAVDEGRLAPGPSAPRAPDPALAAARTFARLLGERGVALASGAVARAAAAPGARELARVESATTAEQVELMLTDSDNTLAEVLGRRVALAAGRPGTFDDASTAVTDAVAALGVDTTGVLLQGVSGLGRGTRLPARVLTDLLVLAASPEHPELSALVSGLPVAGVTGTLTDRYGGEGAPAAGVVRAKTGTLTGVSSLAGYVRDADGRLLAFAVLSDTVPAGASWGARRAEDRFAAALAACGCS
ncbi:D-alanyl-D-alanine carboxypeptidase/D-alanyl-D-alanine endopeptidase [Kineococcus sp. SYSU DK005]|uniref:D-alanyl-D-alanine carboxypeptidase/D-alanyl-D-alanine endopeptidase n=1 Tax=Kineococcus sp. SYSU DK005 TaxID=3383126 RepID=UPI003D7E940F